MILDEKKAHERLNSPDNLANRFSCRLRGYDGNEGGATSQETPVPSRIHEVTLKRAGKDRPNLPEFCRTIIAVEARSGRNQSAIAAEFNTTQGNVSNIKRASPPSGKLDEKAAERALGEIRDRALERLMASLGLMSDEKLSKCDAKDLSTIAANMGKVVEKTFPKQDSNDARININLFVPELRNEKQFKTVEV